MKCDRCNKEKEKTFYRIGGEIEIKGEMTEIKGFSSMCLSCIKVKMKSGGFITAPILTNPTIKPSEDPLEWVLND